MDKMQDDPITSFPFAQPDNSEGDGRRRLSLPTDGVPSTEVAEVAALRALKEELSKIPHGEKSCLVHVQRIQPSLVDDDHLMRFLQTEKFDVHLALKRLLKYWEHRYKVFGPEKFALPMTLSGAMKESIPAIKKGFLAVLPELDEAGRAIIYHRNSLTVGIPADEKIRVWWYVLHVAMENPSVREKGFIMLSNSSESSINHFDGKYILAACHSGDRYFPIRWKMIHVCNARSVVWPYVASGMKAILSKEQRKSFVLHNGSNERILDTLAEYHLPAKCVPSDMGGSLHLSMEAFIQERLAIEGTPSTNDKTLETVSSSSEIASSSSHQEENGNREIETVSKEDCSTVASAMNRTDVESRQGRTAIPPIITNSGPVIPGKAVHEQGGSVSQKMPAAQQKRTKSEPPSPSTKPKKPRATKKAAKSNLSQRCTGDPRMNLAVKAKMENQFLPLLAALEAGGFVFPGLYEPGASTNEVKDTDGVTFYQRRNQLLRRLRLAKEKAGKK